MISVIYEDYLSCLRQSPLASCCSMLISSMAGSLMSGLVLGSPPALAFRGDLTVLAVLTVWLVVFFSPEVTLDVLLETS